DAGTVDQHTRRTMRLGGLRERGFRRGGIGNVTCYGHALDLGGNAFRKLRVEIAYSDPGALRSQLSRRRRAKTRCTAGNNRGLILQLHENLPEPILTKRDDARRRRGRIKLFDQLLAVLQHGALVDRTLVGDLAAVDREGRIEQDRTGDAAGRSGRARKQLLEALAERRPHRRIIGGAGDIISGKLWIDETTTIEIEDNQRRDFVAVDARDHDVAYQRRASGDEACAQGTDGHPGAACKLEILGDAAVEIEAGVEIIDISRLDSVAKLVETFLVEGGLGQFRLTPIARRHVRPAGA